MATCHITVVSPSDTVQHMCAMAFVSSQCVHKKPGPTARFPAIPGSSADGVFIHGVGVSWYKRLPRSAGRRYRLRRFESALDVQRLGNRGQLCETKRGGAPLDTRAIPKAPHSVSRRCRSCTGGVGFVSPPRPLRRSGRPATELHRNSGWLPPAIRPETCGTNTATSPDFSWNTARTWQDSS